MRNIQTSSQESSRHSLARPSSASKTRSTESRRNLRGILQILQYFPSTSVGESEYVFRRPLHFSEFIGGPSLISSESKSIWNEKALWETQTLCAGCSKAEPKIFAPMYALMLTPPQALPGGARGPKFNQLVWWGSMHAISSYRGNRPTHSQAHKHTQPQTDRTDYNTLRRS